MAPYGTGASFYLNPTLIGVEDNIGVMQQRTNIFTVFAMPVGRYFKGSMVPTAFTTSEFDQIAAPHGTGAAGWWKLWVVYSQGENKNKDTLTLYI